MEGGGVTYISVAEFEAWLARARAGERIPYVTGLRIPPVCNVSTSAMQAASAGLVELVQDRRTGPRRYLAERTSKPVPAVVLDRVARRAAPKLDASEDDASALCDLLDGLTRAVRRCPSNAQIAASLDLPEWRVARAFRRLRDRGEIRIELHSAGWSLVRVVTIASSGRSTAAPSPLICPLSAMELGA